jgi:hypothetical protein
MTKQPDQDEQTVKSTLGLVGIAGGYALARDSLPELFSQSHILQNFPNACGYERLLHSVESIVKSVAEADVAALIAKYQFFFPFARNVASIAALKRKTAEAALREAYRDHQYRLQALPAIASVHALGSVHDSEIEYLDDIIVGTLSDALDPSKKPNREILEMVWQNALAALIGSDFNWNGINFSASAIRANGEICARFLAGEKALFYPAIAAFQFLLTYERSLKNRRSIASPNSTRSVLEAFDRINAYSSSATFEWFYRLSNLYQARFTRDEMIPQQSEIALGLAHFPPAIADYFLMTRFYGSYVNNEIRTGGIQTAYVSPQRAEFHANTCKLIFGLNRDHTRQHWQQLRHNPQLNFLAVATARYVDKRLDPTHDQEAEIRFDQSFRDARELAQGAVPLRRIDEAETFDKNVGIPPMALLANHPLSLEFLVNKTLPIAKKFANLFGRSTAEFTDSQLIREILEKSPPDDFAKAIDVLDERRSAASPKTFNRESVTKFEPVTLSPASRSAVVTGGNSLDLQMNNPDAADSLCLSWLACAFAGALLAALTGLIVNVTGIMFQSNSLSTAGAAILAASCFAAALLLMKGEKIIRMGGDLGNGLAPPSHKTF